MSGFDCRWILAACLLTGAAKAQEIRLDGLRPAAPANAHVVGMTDTVTVHAGKPDVIELRFHVDPGFHINSHLPKDETLIPTALKLDAVDGAPVRVLEYPAGRPFTLDIGGAKQQLSVYEGDFRVTVEVRAPHPGSATLTGSLRYQACDGGQCFPARTLPVKVLVTAK